MVFYFFRRPVPRRNSLLRDHPSLTPSRRDTDAADCFAEILEFMAFIKLRISHRDLHRPYEIPLGTVGVCVMLLPPAVFVVLLAAFSSGTTWAVSAGALLIGWAIYPCLQLAKRRQWCEFRATTLYEGEGACGAERTALYGD